MTKLKLTDWYNPSQKPVRKGFYQCMCCKNMFWWNGKFWTDAPWSKYESGIDYWRGIAK